MKPHLLIYTKPPRIGLSKTRLARSLNRAEARRIATRLAHRTVQETLDPRWGTRLYVSPDTYLNPRASSVWPSHMPRFSQGQGDLTDRLNKGLAETPKGPIIFIGTDTPDLKRRSLAIALDGLRTHDAVIGPSLDGGFWLFAMRKSGRSRSPFHPVHWSSADTLTDVKRNLGAQARVLFLETLPDIDIGEDWQRWARAPK